MYRTVSLLFDGMKFPFVDIEEIRAKVADQKASSERKTVRSVPGIRIRKGVLRFRAGNSIKNGEIGLSRVSGEGGNSFTASRKGSSDYNHLRQIDHISANTSDPARSRPFLVGVLASVVASMAATSMTQDMRN